MLEHIKKTNKLKPLKIVLTFLTVILFWQSSNAQFASSSYYLVDSLEINQMKESERSYLDSILKVFHSSNNDSNKYALILTFIENNNNLNVWPKYNNWIIKQVSKKDLLIYKGQALNNKGYYFHVTGQLKLAIEYYFKSLKIFEETKDSIELANSFNNIGSLLHNLDEYENSIEYYKKSYNISKTINYDNGLANAANNIGHYFSTNNLADSAIIYYQSSAEIFKAHKDYSALATTLGNIGFQYSTLGDAKKAKEITKESIEYRILSNDMRGLGYAYDNISSIELTLSNYENAYKFGQKSLKIAKEINDIDLIRRASLQCYNSSKTLKLYKEGLQYYELHIEMRDSIKNKETQKSAIRQQTKYEFEKAQLVKEQEEKELARIVADKIDRRNSLQYSIILVAILFVFGGVLALGKINVSVKFAEGLIFFAFLIFFEFLLVLSDPYIDSITGGAPMYKLLANALLAGLIFPAHAFFENALKKRIINKE